MSENERLERDNEAVVLISSTSEESEGTSSMEEYTVAMPEPYVSDISATPHKRGCTNTLNPNFVAALDLQK